MHALTPSEVDTLLLLVNSLRLKRGVSPVDFKDIEDFLSGIHAAGLVVIERGTLLEFERYSHIVWDAIHRYKEAGLL